jgi:hypothetical protein
MSPTARQSDIERIRAACELAFDATWYGRGCRRDPSRDLATGKDVVVALAVTLASVGDLDPERRWRAVADVWAREEPRMKFIFQDPRLRRVAEQLASRATEMLHLQAS